MAYYNFIITYKMNVWIGSRPPRGSKQLYPEQPDCIRIDVSSGSMKKINKLYMKNLSPLLLGPVFDNEGNEYVTFENLWQYNKVYPQLDHWDFELKIPTEKWFLWRKRGMTLLKNGKGIRTVPEVAKLKKTGNWKPIGMWYNNVLLDYIDARKCVYNPIYADKILQTPEFQALKNLAETTGVLIIELDGPPLTIFPDGILATKKNICKAINNEKYPFGHCYVVASLLIK